MMKSRGWGNLVGTVAALSFLVGATVAEAQRDRRGAFLPVSARAASIEIAAEPASYEVPSSTGLAELVATASCSSKRPRAIDVALSWDAEGAAVRIDITAYNDGFATGRFLTSGLRPASSGELVFDAAQPGIYYYWRLLTEASGGWTVRANGRFEAPVCPADLVPE